MGQDLLEAYLSRGMNQVQGWLDSFSARAVAAIGREQQRLGLTGAVGEIGVHHGRLFILLYLLSAPEERAFAVDVFSDQTRNVDESGRGNEAIFLSNLSRLPAVASESSCSLAIPINFGRKTSNRA